MAQRGSPAGAGTANKIEVVTRLGKACEEWLTVAFALRILFDHEPVHNFLDDKQLRKSADSASICPAATS